jgi:hypothetical protein
MTFWESEPDRVIRDDEECFMESGKLVSFLLEEKVSE